jgi:hypothetical protein
MEINGKNKCKRVHGKQILFVQKRGKLLFSGVGVFKKNNFYSQIPVGHAAPKNINTI